MARDPDLITMEIFQEVANSVDRMISFTFDVPSLKADRKIAILDLKLDVDQSGSICHEFYEKPTKHPQTILANSALSFSQKKL